VFEIANGFLPRSINAELLRGVLVSGLITAFAIAKLHPVAERLRLLDEPAGRKQHLFAIPPIGGLCSALGIGVAGLLAPFGMAEFRYLGLAALGILLVGILDDLKEVSVFQKIVAQFLIAAFLVVVGNLTVVSVGDIFAWKDGNEQGLSWLSQPFTVIAIVAAINAFNLIDGHDGLSGSLFFVSLLSILAITAGLHEDKLVYLCGILSSATCAFLYFNLRNYPKTKYKVFLGDAGSTMIGLILAYLLIRLSLPDPHRIISPAIAPWIIGLPVLDMAAVLAKRLIQRVSVSLPDRQHIHHQLLDYGLPKHTTLIVLLALHTALCLVGVISHKLAVPDWALFWGYFSAGLIYIGFRISR
jgi:UDP-GlcNAc:undecaprenyl-phosphate GlcNAc-1-phosphate transferase